MPPKSTPRYRPQDSNYIGTIASQLADLHGYDTLAYELIQNADDVKTDQGALGGATRILFDVRDDALIVENDGVFRRQDFDRMAEILHGAKRAEQQTTGAFGIGFVSVYQVTDAPEIFSGGEHWTIRPLAERDRRIEIYDRETHATRFRLPWAFDAKSATRQALGAATVEPAALDDIALQIATAVRQAALFLRQIDTLEVRRNGDTLLQLQRRRENDTLILDDQQSQTTYTLYTGDFAAAAQALRNESAIIDAERPTDVLLAVPAQADGPGRLYATLPSQSELPLPIIVNAPFFPTTDRKQVRLDEAGERAAWNMLALDAAADLLASVAVDLAPRIGAAAWWQMAQQAYDQRDHRQWGVFWQRLEPELRRQPTAYSQQGAWLRPDQVAVPRSRDEIAAATILAELGVPLAHSDLRPSYYVLRQVGAPLLAVADIAATNRFKSGDDWRAALPDQRQWQRLWHALRAVVRDPDRRGQQQELLRLPLAWNAKGKLRPLNRLWRGDHRLRALFNSVDWLDDELSDVPLLRDTVAEFDMRAAVEFLLDEPADLREEAWRWGRYDPVRLFEWLELNQVELMMAPQLSELLKKIALIPIDGRLLPLNHVFLPSGFVDPLGLANTIDSTTVGDRFDLLRRLDVAELDFDSYIEKQLPLALREVDKLPSDRLWRLIELLAQRLGELRSMHVQQVLAGLPLVACLDGRFRSAGKVYFDSPQLRDLLPNAHFAETPTEAVAELYRWLGVGSQPRLQQMGQIIARVESLLQQRQAPPPAVYQFLNEHHDHAALQALQTLPFVALDDGSFWLPADLLWQSHPFGPYRRQLPAGWRDYEKLLTRFGAHERPTGRDALAVLTAIGAEKAAPLDAETAPIVAACWRLLQQALTDGALEPADFAPLHEIDVVSNGDLGLAPPNRLFFADGDQLQRRFSDLLSGRLIEHDEQIEQALAAAGVRRLRDVVTIEFDQPLRSTAAADFAARLQARRAQLRRVLADDAAVARLLQIDYQEVETLAPRYGLTSAEGTLKTEPAPLPALYLAPEGRLYLTQSKTALDAAAAEMARLLQPQRESGWLAAAISVVLTADSAEAAAQRLDLLGFA